MGRRSRNNRLSVPRVKVDPVVEQPPFDRAPRLEPDCVRRIAVSPGHEETDQLLRVVDEEDWLKAIGMEPHERKGRGSQGGIQVERVPLSPSPDHGLPLGVDQSDFAGLVAHDGRVEIERTGVRGGIHHHDRGVAALVEPAGATKVWDRDHVVVAVCRDLVLSCPVDPPCAKNVFGSTCAGLYPVWV